MGGNNGDVVHKCIYRQLVNMQRIRHLVQFSVRFQNMRRRRDNYSSVFCAFVLFRTGEHAGDCKCHHCSISDVKPVETGSAGCWSPPPPPSLFCYRHVSVRQGHPNCLVQSRPSIGWPDLSIDTSTTLVSLASSSRFGRRGPWRRHETTNMARPWFNASPVLFRLSTCTFISW